VRERVGRQGRAGSRDRLLSAATVQSHSTSVKVDAAALLDRLSK
jgi:hypothetical protein